MTMAVASELSAWQVAQGRLRSVNKVRSPPCHSKIVLSRFANDGSKRKSPCIDGAVIQLRLGKGFCPDR